MAGVNKAILLGNVGKDPEVRHLDNGRAVCNFSLATSETYKNKQGEKVTETQWHNIVLWSPLAEVAEKYVKKGTQLHIIGKITTRSWDDNDGNKRYTTEIVGREMIMLGNKSQGGGGQQQSSAAQTSATESIPEDDTDDLPF